MQDNLQEIQDWHEHFRVPGIDVKSAYENASDSYDEIMKNAGTIAPQILCSMMQKNIKDQSCKDDTRILDFGCGTGLVGEILASLGYKNITGLDMSEPMMAKAKEKNIYSSLRKFEMGKGEMPQDLEGKFDVAMAAAVFLPGHAPPQGFDDMLKSLKIGGLAILSCAVKDWEKGEYSQAMKLREAKGQWELVEGRDQQNYQVYKELSRHDRFFAFRKLK